MTDSPRFYWQRHTDGAGGWKADGPPGQELAALRRGIGRDPGTVPQMWPYYTTLTADGHLTSRLTAEHVALTLFAVHQQSQARPVHRDGVGLGTALLNLRRTDKFSPEALDRRFGAAATATSVGELAHHLRGLITQLRAVSPPAGLDYTQLTRDIRDWHIPDSAARVRRRWGAQYFVWSRELDAPPTTKSA